MHNGIISARRVGRYGAWQGEIKLYKGDELVEIRVTELYKGDGAKKRCLSAASILRDRMEESADRKSA